ncbi:hypothetical protein [Nostoc sp. JL33]|nr:hypothetical protein [Nostoc sp. JL33]MBN3869819.1 hypothetical protein [Nostoc sp. JL33]
MDVNDTSYIYMAIANYDTSISSKSRSKQLSQLAHINAHVTFWRDALQ